MPMMQSLSIPTLDVDVAGSVNEYVNLESRDVFVNGGTLNPSVQF
jgi:hypothetical protein